MVVSVPGGTTVAPTTSLHWLPRFTATGNLQLFPSRGLPVCWVCLSHTDSVKAGHGRGPVRQPDVSTGPMVVVSWSHAGCTRRITCRSLHGIIRGSPGDPKRGPERLAHRASPAFTGGGAIPVLHAYDTPVCSPPDKGVPGRTGLRRIGHECGCNPTAQQSTGSQCPAVLYCNRTPVRAWRRSHLRWAHIGRHPRPGGTTAGHGRARVATSGTSASALRPDRREGGSEQGRAPPRAARSGPGPRDAPRHLAGARRRLRATERRRPLPQRR